MMRPVGTGTWNFQRRVAVSPRLFLGGLFFYPSLLPFGRDGASVFQMARSDQQVGGDAANSGLATRCRPVTSVLGAAMRGEAERTRQRWRAKLTVGQNTHDCEGERAARHLRTGTVQP